MTREDVQRRLKAACADDRVGQLSFVVGFVSATLDDVLRTLETGRTLDEYDLGKIRTAADFARFA